MKKTLLYLLLFVSSLSYAQVGIGTTTPKAFLNVPAGRTVLFGDDSVGTNSSYNLFYPKLIWYSSKGAFRVGGVSGDRDYYSVWDNANVGKYSFAGGLNSQASGDYTTSIGLNTKASGISASSIGQYTNASGNFSTALGYGTYATGNGATSMGQNTTASGENSTSMGYQTYATREMATSMGYQTRATGGYSTSMNYQTTASGNYATSMGYQTIASGSAAFSTGNYTTASGNYAVSLGDQTRASGWAAVSMGEKAVANGDNSFAIGKNVSTYLNTGSFILGDNTTTTYNNSAYNQMMMRFSGGYRLYSTAPTDQNTAVGVYLPPGGNSWTTISDSTRKENLRQVDGTSFLQKIARMRLGSWNYKGQDARQYRHYGPMAQDFFAAFGHDELGTIGEDKSINQADFDGVNLIAIQALIKEVNQLKAELSAAKEQEQTTQARLDKIEALLQDHASQATLIHKP